MMFTYRSVLHYNAKGKDRSNSLSSAPPSDFSPPKPPSLDPFLPEPTTHRDDDVSTPVSGAPKSGAGSVSSEKPFVMTSRFKHTTGEDGTHYVLTGRDEKLEKCEDEVGNVPGSCSEGG
jgi:hypothetical protein